MRHGIGRRYARIVALLATLALLATSAVGLLASSAVGFTNPYGLQPGAAGGPPTAPNGSRGVAATNAGVTELGDSLAGYTPQDILHIETVTLAVHFPRAGTLYGRIGVAGVGEIGDGFAGRANAGLKPMSVSLSAKGRNYLASVGDHSVTITLKYAFQPNVGRTQYSTASVVTNP